MFGLDDITYCIADCAEKKRCARNPALIEEPQYPHSYSDFSRVCVAYVPKNGQEVKEDAYNGSRKKNMQEI